MTKFLKPVLALTLVAAMAVGGSLAYITSTTDKIDNKFVIATPGDSSAYLDISLDETFTINGDKAKDNTVKFLPGDTIVKSPVVSIDKLDTDALTEGAYVFVKIDDVNVLDLGFAVNETAWKPLADNAGVYYMQVTDKVETTKALANVFSTTTITIRTNYTANTFDTVQTLSVQAYAIQANNIADAATAWAAVK